MTFTVAELGGLLLIIFGVTHWLGIFASVRAVTGFLGVVLIGTSGFIGSFAARIGEALQHAIGAITAWAVGASLAFGLFIVLAIVFAHDVHPKNKAGRRTGWIGIVLGSLVVAGVQGIPALHGLRTGIVSAASAAIQAL